MDERAVGIVLRTRPLTETSLIIHWLTADQGRIATVAKGARRPKSTFRGKIDLFFACELSFQRSRRSDLHNLREVRLSDSHPGIRRDLDILQQASYAASLIEKATEPETPLSELFGLMTDLLKHLNTSPWQSLTVPAFELKALQALGLEPDFDSSRLRSDTRSLADTLLSIPWHELPSTPCKPESMRELNRFLHGFLVWQFDRLPRGRDAALKLEG